MGPLSTIELMRKVIEKTPVKTEQDHVRMLVDNRPEIPDRTAYILAQGPSPIPMLQESARLLEEWGADLLAIPCNSAHAFIQQIREAISIPVLDMIDLVRLELERNLPAGATVGLLATTGTIRTKLYPRYLKQFSIITPEPAIQEELVMDAVYGERGFKTGGDIGESRRKLWEAIESMKPLQPKAIIAGCTEVELILTDCSVGIPVYYPLSILAQEIVNTAALR